jgi:hypothetical protein
MLLFASVIVLILILIYFIRDHKFVRECSPVNIVAFFFGAMPPLEERELPSVEPMCNPRPDEVEGNAKCFQRINGSASNSTCTKNGTCSVSMTHGPIDFNNTRCGIGNQYTQSIFEKKNVPPAYEIKLFYRSSCTKHHLVGLFDLIAKQFLSDPTTAAANIKFTKELVNDRDLANFDGEYPKIIKIRRNGQVLEYKGATNYGSLSDWILNQGLLF